MMIEKLKNLFSTDRTKEWQWRSPFRLGFQAPDGELDLLLPLSDYHWIIASKVLESDTYREFFRARRLSGAYLTVANISPTLPDVLALEAARLVDAQEFAYADSEETRYTERRIEYGYNAMPILSIPESMPDAVLNITTMIDCGAKVIGLHAHPTYTQYLRTTRLPRDVRFHIVGIHVNPVEIRVLAQIPQVRSLSTSSAVVAAIAGAIIDPHYGMDTFEMDMRDVSNYLDSVVRHRALVNQTRMLAWAAYYGWEPE